MEELWPRYLRWRRAGATGLAPWSSGSCFFFWWFMTLTGVHYDIYIYIYSQHVGVSLMKENGNPNFVGALHSGPSSTPSLGAL